MVKPNFEQMVMPRREVLYRYAFISWCRRHKQLSLPVSLDVLENPEPLLPHEPGPEKKILSGIEYEALCRAVAKLPPDCCHVLVLADFQGLTYRQISERLGISVGTVHSRLFHARIRIRRARFAWRPDVRQRTTIFRRILKSCEFW